jgi:hypothetical protein
MPTQKQTTFLKRSYQLCIIPSHLVGQSPLVNVKYANHNRIMLLLIVHVVKIFASFARVDLSAKEVVLSSMAS